jgi:phytoene synthase
LAEFDDSLEARVRAADPDRWLSSRFVSDPLSRADLITLYAFEAELMAIPTRVTQPLLAEMRYAWWREQLDGVWAGEARKGHPVLEALTDLVARHAPDRAPFEALIEAHIGRVHGEPHDLDAFYVGPMQIAVQILAGAGHAAKVVGAGRQWGLGQTGRLAEASDARRQAHMSLSGLPPQAFPAVAHAVLVGGPGSAFSRRLRIIWAIATGRV